jgi:hypothetical protein
MATGRGDVRELSDLVGNDGLAGQAGVLAEH